MNYLILYGHSVYKYNDLSLAQYFLHVLFNLLALERRRSEEELRDMDSRNKITEEMVSTCKSQITEHTIILMPILLLSGICVTCTLVLKLLKVKKLKACRGYLR